MFSITAIIILYQAVNIERYAHILKGEVIMKKFLTVFTSTQFYCFLAATVLITVCSKSSFLYPLNDWGDANCYFIIGKGMLQGLVPYRDLYDQKGIIIFFLYSLSALISNNSFFGVYILEILLATLFLYISLKTVRLFTDTGKYSLTLALILAIASYSSSSFCHGGSAEEILLPAFAYSIYIISQQTQTHTIPSQLQMFLFGLCSAIVFFSKFTLCAFIIPIIVIMIIDAYMNKQLGLLMKRVIYYILGCVAIIIPIILYFGLNDAISVFIDSYFYNNIFNYIPDKSAEVVDYTLLQETLIRSSLFFRKRNIIPIILIGLGMIYLFIKKNYMLLICHLLSFLALFYMQFFVGAPLKYYGIPLYSLAAAGLCVCAKVFENKIFTKPYIINTVAIFLAIIIGYIFTDNKYWMFKDYDDTHQAIFANDIKNLGYDDYKLVVYDPLDEGFYVACDTMPMSRAFIQTNLTSSFLKDEQNKIINNKEADFIITKKILCDSNDYEETYNKYKDFIDVCRNGSTDSIVEFDNFGYELVDEKSTVFEKTFNIYKIYKKKS